MSADQHVVARMPRTIRRMSTRGARCLMRTFQPAAANTPFFSGVYWPAACRRARGRRPGAESGLGPAEFGPQMGHGPQPTAHNLHQRTAARAGCGCHDDVPGSGRRKGHRTCERRGQARNRRPGRRRGCGRRTSPTTHLRVRWSDRVPGNAGPGRAAHHD